jgi:hypothetical protein
MKYTFNRLEVKSHARNAEDGADVMTKRIIVRGDLTGQELFFFPWPGPGNSEGPVDPEGWVDVPAVKFPAKLPGGLGDTPLVSTSAWPGPGDSE